MYATPLSTRLSVECIASISMPPSTRKHHAVATSMAALLDNPPPRLVPDVAARAATSGNRPTMFLGEAHETFAYNPETGEILWRTPSGRAGFLATKPTTDGRALRVDYSSRRYPAHALAYFLAHSTWPRPRALRWKNGNSLDNRLSNLTMEPTT